MSPTAACESRAPRRDTKYKERGILSCRMRTSARSFLSTSQRTHMRGTMATPMPICTKRLMLSMVGIPKLRESVVRYFTKNWVTHENGTEIRGLRETAASFHQLRRRSPATKSKCWSRLTRGRECWRQSAAIQRSLAGMGLPFLFNSSPMAE